jgi:putative membrane protein
MKGEIKDLRITDHMANERTFLAWIRTNIGIMAFGFVIEKFGIFIRQIGLVLGKGAVQNMPTSHGYSEIIGVLIVGFGILMNLIAYINFKRVEKQIEQRAMTYHSSGTIYALLIITIIAVGIFLIIYLLQNRF